MPLPVRRRFLMDRFIEYVLMTVAGSACGQPAGTVRTRPPDLQ